MYTLPKIKIKKYKNNLETRKKDENFNDETYTTHTHTHTQHTYICKVKRKIQEKKVKPIKFFIT